MKDELHIALIQSDISWLDPEANFASFADHMPLDADVILLPETFATGFATKDLDVASDPQTVDAIQAFLLLQANRCQSFVGGSAFVKVDDRCRNRFFLASPQGELNFVDKRHMFSIAGEAEHFDAGQSQVTVQVHGWAMRLAVCYDLRFPVWLRNDPKDPYDALLLVANWPESRVDAWTTLLRARAMENQCYVAGVNRVGVDGFKVPHSGQSQLIGPEGGLLTQGATHQQQVLRATWSSLKLKAVRKRYPFLNDGDAFTLD